MDVIKVVTLKTFQKVLGKIGYLVMLCSNLRSACAILNIEKARFEKHFHSENELPGRKQMKVAFLSLRARKDLKDIRAVLASIREHPLPLENYKIHKYLAADIFFCGDASGKIDDLQYPAALGVYIPLQIQTEALALSYILPRKWLLSRDEARGQNKSNSVLLELLSLITPLVEFPEKFRNKSVNFQTDNMALSQLYLSMSPQGEATAYVLRALNFVTQALNIRLQIEWKRRRSDQVSKIADDLTHSKFSLVSTKVGNRRVGTNR